VATEFWTAYDDWEAQPNNPAPTYEGWKAAMLQWKTQQTAGGPPASNNSALSHMWALVPVDKSQAVTTVADDSARLDAFWKGCHKWRKICKPGNTYIYGVADNNLIYEVNVNRQSARSVLDVSPYIGSNPAGSFNSFAFDVQHDTFYFMNSDLDILAWERATGAVGVVAPKQSTTRFNPANAAYYDGAYWFVETTNTESTNITLVRVAFTPSVVPGGLPTLGGKTTYDVALTSPGGSPFTIRNGYGDIAVSASGDLYITPVVLDPAVPDSGSMLVLKNLGGLAPGGGSATAVAVAQTGLPGPQLSFDCPGRTLWGQTYNGCEWSTIDAATGVPTPRFTLSLPGAPDPTTCLRDLGGAACTCALPVAE